jgi:transcriptional regulator with XRE-family HTH domain
MTGLTTEEWEQRIGEQVRAVRVRSQLNQAELARLADINVNSVRALERGAGSSLKTLIAVGRVLGRLDWFEGFDPQGDGPTPMELLRASRNLPQRPQRVRKPKS